MFMTNEVKGSDKKKSVTCKLKLRDKSSVLRRKVSEVSSREFQERERDTERAAKKYYFQQDIDDKRFIWETAEN